MKKDIQLTDGDQVTIYELSFTMYVCINQANNFVFSDLNVWELHKQYELSIHERQGGKEADFPALFKTDKLDGPWLLKCE